MITTEALTKRFGTITAVDHLSLHVNEGEIYGLVGPDGAGKTTAMRLLTGILDPTSGTAQVAGFDIVKQAEQLKEQIGYMSQRFGLYPDLTVIENINFYADIYCVPEGERPGRIERLLEFSKLGPFQKRLTGNLSGGMKQKLGLACALIHTPKVLFLDEPTSGVDPVSRRDFWHILTQLQEERVTILLTTTYLDEAERCHRVGLLHEGHLVAMGTPEEIKTLMPGKIIEIICSVPRRAAEIIGNSNLPTTVLGLFGDRLHLVMEDDPDVVGAAAATLLRDEGIEVEGINRTQPTIEDVFISIITSKREQLNDGS